jgi:chemotaxis regulatin CheY-phosphate phosphatase CheZ
MASDNTNTKSEDITKQFESFLDILHAITPLVTRIKASLQASSRSLPNASQQLSSVTAATETATVEILNTLGSLTESLGKMEQCITTLNESQVRRRTLAHSLVAMIDQLAGENGGKGLLVGFREDILKLSGEETETPVLADLGASLEKAKLDSMNIAMALQVQDITTQQIAGVLDVISTIETQLTHAMKPFQDKPEEDLSHHLPDIEEKPKHYDGDAEYTKSTVKQDDADRLIQEFLAGAPPAP